MSVFKEKRDVSACDRADIEYPGFHAFGEKPQVFLDHSAFIYSSRYFRSQRFGRGGIDY